MYLKISKARLLLILSLFIFKFSLDVCYILFVNCYFEYCGFDLDVSTLKYLLSWLPLLVLLPFTPYQLDKPSNYFFMTIILSLIVPLTTLYGLSSRNIDPLIITIFYFFIIYFISKIKLVNRIQPYYVKNGRKIAVIISLFFILLVAWWYFFSGAYIYFNLNFAKVYQFRALSNKLANVGVMAYIIGWVYKVFIVYLIAYTLQKKNFVFFIVLCFIQVFFYGVSGQKSVFFTPILVFSIWFYFRNFKTLFILPIGFTVVVIVSYFSFFLFNDMLMPSMFIRRVFFVPAKLSYDYLDFFAENDFIYWSNSFLSHFIEYPYSKPLAELIGNYEGTGSHANNGFVASGYAHFGLVGVTIYSVMLGFILKILDYIAVRQVPVWFVLCVVVVPLRDALISSDLLTTLLTHGLIVALILLLLSIDNNKVYYKK